ncbi:Transcriptional regulator [Cronobacter universalis NCTC 9529]|uniref:HTH-type transcriptional regulator sinR n=1 Tax=Cronobacter universalis NCTC 9529 TaxID=1074000 RepID=A0AAC8VQ45_9ENTR|nr:XRE family transcriptional regulator [Cronobacter universalis]ALB54999.1 XRE family transcriptional regulator [Cronobacter universalis NCTC 9529]CCK14506.1 Transcriptional regulator [Cronobacter universalis NCTC 9529]STD08112.1 HTH-type transcriptional regulator sinR [Cronobacter universalis NCTC 9529]
MTHKVNILTEPGADADSLSVALAQRLKSWRKEHNVTLDALSRRASVSKGMLVELEKAAANPSIAILCKIAGALGISVADLLDVASQPAARLIEASQIPVLWTGESGGSARLLAGTSGPNMVELWRWEMRPGDRFTSPGHPQGTSELLHVEQGILTLSVNDERLQVKAGASAVARTDAPHGYANEQQETLIFTMTVYEPH